jgi:hypothetical protein
MHTDELVTAARYQAGIVASGQSVAGTASSGYGGSGSGVGGGTNVTSGGSGTGYVTWLPVRTGNAIPGIYPTSVGYAMGQSWKQAKDVAGIYGWMLDQARAGNDIIDYSNVIADSRAMTSQRRQFWDSGINGLGGEINELIRRAIGKNDKWAQRVNPIPNTMPSWLPGEEYYTNFKTGDPYVKIAHGEERLPGGGYESLNYIPKMQLRASQVGRSVEDQVNYILHRDNPVSDVRLTDQQKQSSIDAMEEGTKLHRKIERQWSRAGLEVSTEGEVYNKKYDVTGHYDAILARPFGYEVADIKTVNQRRWDEMERTGHPYEEHMDQTNFYLNTLGINRGAIYYLNRDNPEETRWFEFNYDQRRFDRTMTRVAEARRQAQAMIDRGEANEYELYDLYNRYKILADVAPYSEQYKWYRDRMVDTKDQLTPKQVEDFQKTKEELSAQRHRLNLFPYRFKNSDINYESVTIQKIYDNNTFVAKEYPDHPIRLAGVSLNGEDNKAVDYFQGSFHPGKRVMIGYSSDPNQKYSDDSLGTIRAVVYSGGAFGAATNTLTNMNRDLVRRGYAKEKEDDYSPAAIHARFSNSEITFGKLWEFLSHRDTPFNTKFLQIRSPLESYKRRDLYGKDWQPWDIKDQLIPTLESTAAKNPLAAALGMGGLAYLAWRGPNRMAAFGVGAAFGAALSTLRAMNEKIKNEAYIPDRRVKEREIDEYFDVLNYVKYKGLYEAGLRELKEDGIDLEKKINRAEYRERNVKQNVRELGKEKKLLKIQDKIGYKQEIKSLNEELKTQAEIKKRYKDMHLSPREQQVLDYREKYYSTLYGLELGGPMQRLFKAMPQKDREYLPYFMEANEQERKEILRLVPKNQRRVYQAIYGLKQDEKPSLREYFSKHYLPSAKWEGWGPGKNLDDIKVKIINDEGLDLTEFGFWKDDLVRSQQNQAPYVDMDAPNYRGANIEKQLREILKGYGLDNVAIDVQASNVPGIAISMDIEKDRRQEIEDYVKQNDLSEIFN